MTHPVPTAPHPMLNIKSLQGRAPIEHDLDVVSSLCDTVVVLDFGQVIAAGPPAEVLSAPEVVAAYLGQAS